MMTSKDKLNHIANCVDSSKCDLMQIDLFKKSIEKDLELLEKYKLIDSILDDASMTRCTLPNGKVISTDIGYVCDFWDEFKNWLESVEVDK